MEVVGLQRMHVEEMQADWVVGEDGLLGSLGVVYFQSQCLEVVGELMWAFLQ